MMPNGREDADDGHHLPGSRRTQADFVDLH